MTVGNPIIDFVARKRDARPKIKEAAKEQAADFEFDKTVYLLMQDGMKLEEWLEECKRCQFQSPYRFLQFLSPSALGEWAVNSIKVLDENRFTTAEDKYHDILFDRTARIECKASRIWSEDGTWWFNHCKIGMGLCDLWICVGAEENQIHYWVFTPEEMEQIISGPMGSGSGKSDSRWTPSCKNIPKFKEYEVTREQLLETICFKLGLSKERPSWCEPQPDIMDVLKETPVIQSSPEPVQDRPIQEVDICRLLEGF